MARRIGQANRPAGPDIRSELEARWEALRSRLYGRPGGDTPADRCFRDLLATNYGLDRLPALRLGEDVVVEGWEIRDWFDVDPDERFVVGVSGAVTRAAQEVDPPRTPGSI